MIQYFLNCHCNYYDTIFSDCIDINFTINVLQIVLRTKSRIQFSENQALTQPPFLFTNGATVLAMQRCICSGMLRASLCIFFSWKYKAKRPARAYRQIMRLHVTQLSWNSSSHTPRSASDVFSGVRAKRFAKLVNNIACFPSTSTTLFLKQSDNWSRCIKCTLLSPSKCNTTSCAKLTPFATTGSTILSRDIPFMSPLPSIKGVFKLISAIVLSRSQPILDLYPASPITVFLKQTKFYLYTQLTPQSVPKPQAGTFFVLILHPWTKTLICGMDDVTSTD